MASRALSLARPSPSVVSLISRRSMGQKDAPVDAAREAGVSASLQPADDAGNNGPAGARQADRRWAGRA